jgi:hypothetical protein
MLHLYRIEEKINPLMKKAYRAVFAPPLPDLRGDRDVEYSFVAANMPDGPGRAIDFGSGPSWMGLLAARKGFTVTSLDLGEMSWFYSHPRLNFLCEDIFKSNFPAEHFDLIINCSAIEHVGLRGRYGVTEERPDGDIEAMGILRIALKRSGTMLLTIPVGRDSVFSPLHRVYGLSRLLRLLDGYNVLRKEFWVKDDQNKWIGADESVVLDKQPVIHCYGLGLFVLRPAAR